MDVAGFIVFSLPDYSFGILLQSCFKPLCTLGYGPIGVMYVEVLV